MNDNMNWADSRAMRKRLLATASTAALLLLVCGKAHAGFLTSSGSPPVWIELGGQFDSLDRGPDVWTVPFDSNFSGVDDSIRQHSRRGYDMDALLSWQPGGGKWIFSASIRYGRGVHQQGFHTQTPSDGKFYSVNTFDSRARAADGHMILDFQAGKDVGMGMFGHSGSSILSAGVRVAKFKSDSKDFVTYQPARGYYEPLLHRDFIDKINTDHSSWLVGPSVSWNGFAPLAGSSDGGFTLDWGANAALLFGKQRTNIHAISHYDAVPMNTNGVQPIDNTTDTTHSREKQVTVPAAGGFIGLSIRWTAAKISAGYRGDFYFNALDGGFAERKSIDRSFWGPFVNISVGVGD